MVKVTPLKQCITCSSKTICNNKIEFCCMKGNICDKCLEKMRKKKFSVDLCYSCLNKTNAKNILIIPINTQTRKTKEKEYENPPNSICNLFIDNGRKIVIINLLAFILGLIGYAIIITFIDIKFNIIYVWALGLAMEIITYTFITLLICACKKCHETTRRY